MSQSEEIKGVKVAVIGTGYWGKHYVRILGAQCEIAIDAAVAAREKIQSLYPSVTTGSTIDDAIQSNDVQALIVVTPAVTHYDVVKSALLAGKHVLVEKPLTLQVSHAKELLEIAREKKLTLMVGHTFLFNASVWHLNNIVSDRAKFGDLRYISARRTNLGPVRNDCSVLWDLAPHDISIIHALNKGSLPIKVSCTGQSVLSNTAHIDVAFLTVTYDNGTIAHVHVSWCDPHKVRKVHAIGSQMRVTFDDMSNHPITCFHQSVDVDPQNQERSVFSDGDIIMPHVQPSEPLSNQVNDFLAKCCGNEGGTPLSKINETIGLIVVQVLTAAEQSVQQGGAPLIIEH